jgi:hypothetical protein
MSQIIGVFRDSAAALRAVDQLVEHHFAPRREIVVRATNAAGVSEEVRSSITRVFRSVSRSGCASDCSLAPWWPS